MSLDGVQVHGAAGPPVLLLPGGAEACDGFFPGLVQGLTTDPGCRVIVHDRPGTGTSRVPGTLADASAHLNSLIGSLGCGPVVVVGQSLGGAVATLLARDHPESVAGLVLLDPTPVNDAPTCARLERTMRVLERLTSRSAAHRLLASTLRASLARTARKRQLRPDCAAALTRTAHLDVPQLATAVRGVAQLARTLREDDLPRVPTVVVTADRKPNSPVLQAHTRLAAAFGGRIAAWPGATHSVHLDYPDETLATVREVITEAGAAK